MALTDKNLYAYCDNNPVMRTDINGEFGEEICEWFSNAFGFGVVQSNTYQAFSVETLFWGTETGTTTTKVILGDVSKPISFYVTNASEPHRFWEYKLGIQININGGGVALETNLIDNSLALSDGNRSLELIAGLNKVGYTTSYQVDFGKRTGGGYYHQYVRTLPLVGAGALIYYTGGAAAGALAPVMLK